MFINIQLFAHKKGMGSSKNGRDSAAQRLGVKRSDGQFVVRSFGRQSEIREEE